MIKKICSILSALILFAAIASAQQGKEILVDLESVPYFSYPSGLKNQKSVLQVPFYDDFSQGKHFPRIDLWNGKDVLVNTNLPLNSQTVGVATFDALNSKGELHHNVSTFPFSADTLTSKAINLNYSGDTTIYISFFFQPQGLGNQPDLRDSLVLEFYDYQNEQWVGAWAAWANFSSNTIYQIDKLKDKLTEVESINLNSTFFRAHFSILDSRFLTSNFKLRFRNYATISPNNDVPGLRGNSDHWHIDMVYLNKNRSFSDTIVNDVTFFRPLRSFLKNYHSIPWLHFNAEAQNQEITDPLEFPIHYKNLGPTTRSVTRRFSILNHSNQSVFDFTGGTENISPFDTVSYTRYFFYDFESAWSDSAKFTFTTYTFAQLLPGTSPQESFMRWNDTLRFTQSFRNYYAYDDGFAESGYGLYGEGTQNGRVAVKFESYKSDYLNGVDMYFNRTLNDANDKYFKLAVWNDNNGKPGDIIYQQAGVRPAFSDSLNRYAYFGFDEDLWIEAGPFYVGWVQTTTDMLNVGFDRNNVNNSKLFYSITGDWKNSQFGGSLMIRPVFGESNNEIPVVSKNQKLIFPNPANSFFSIDLPQTQESLTVSVFNLSGQLVQTVQYQIGQNIYINDLPSGTYIVRIVGDRRLIGTQKLIVFK